MAIAQNASMPASGLYLQYEESTRKIQQLQEQLGHLSDLVDSEKTKAYELLKAIEICVNRDQDRVMWDFQ